MDQSSLDETLNHWRLELENIAPELHILCPMTHADDPENYAETEPTSGITAEEKKKRLEDAKERINITMWNSLLFGVERKKVEQWLETYASRLQNALSSCDACIKNWHRCRKSFLIGLSENYSHEVVSALERLIVNFDFDRLDSRLKWSRDRIEAVEQPGKPFKLQILGADVSAVLLTVYESMCCVDYLRIPDKRKNFEFVFQRLSGGKKPLRLGANTLLPAMTEFLFDPDPVCLRFANAAWASLDPGSMSADQFDWAVGEFLVRASVSVGALDITQPQNLEQISRFWSGALAIFNVMTPDVIVHRYRALEERPNLYDLLFIHMQCQSEEILLLVLDAFSVLISKAPAAFWDALSHSRPFSVVEPAFAAPMLKTLFNKTPELGLSISGLPKPIAWISIWGQSLSRDQRGDACSSLLHLLFENFVKDPSLGEHGKAACVKAGLDTLADLLDSYLNPTNEKDALAMQSLASSNNLVFVNNALNMTLKYSEIIVMAAENKRQLIGEKEAAVSVIEKALLLDARAFAAEAKQLHMGGPVQQMVTRNSAGLWDAYLELIYPGNLTLATTMLRPLLSILPVEQFRHERKATKPMLPAKVAFNKRFGESAAVIGRLLQRLCDFDECDKQVLSQDSHLRILLAMMLHGEEEVSLAAIELVKTITGQGSRSEAVLKLITERPAPVIRAFTVAINTTAKPYKNKDGEEVSPPWGSMKHILNTAKDIINGLFDPTIGVLRVKSLDRSEIDTVHAWWLCQWHWVQVCFDATQNWSYFVEIKIMTDFCREVIELAESLSSNDGVLSASSKDNMLKAAVASGATIDEEGFASKAMIRTLEPCRRFLMGLVRMIRLKDEYLVEITTKIICKLLNRLSEYKLPIPDDVQMYLQRACKPRPTDGRFEIGTKLSSQQKAELLRAASIDDDDDDVTIVSVIPSARAGSLPGPPGTGRTNAKGQVQAKLDLTSWGKLGAGASSSTPLTGRTNADDVADLSSTLESSKSTLDAMAAKEAKLKSKSTSVAMQSIQAIRAKAAEQSAVVQAKHAEKVKAKQSALKEARQRERDEMARKRAEFIARDRAARGIVIKEKEKSEIMVDSSDEEEDDDDDDDGEASSLIRSSKAGMDALNEAERRREKALMGKIRGPVKKIKIQRTAKDNRARLTPPMDTLHSEILSWDIFHDGDAPPNGLELMHVATTFAQPVLYKNTFLPLLIYEAWRSFATDKNECTAKAFGIKIITRMTVDRFLEITTTMPATNRGENRERVVSEGDIVLISNDEDPLNNAAAAHCLARIWRVTFKKGVLEVTWRLNQRENPLARDLTPGAMLNAVRITNMTTIEREYAALEALQYYDLMDEVLKGEPSPILNYSDEQIRRYMDNWKLNAGQAKAVLGAKDNDGFTLIQGPPGTGKTKTIVAMVGCLLAGSLASSSTTSSSSSMGITSIKAIGQQPPPARKDQQTIMKKLLVCAPSNAAVDELVLRLKQGVKTAGGQHHKINVIRLGRSDAINAAVRDVTLDIMVQTRLEGDQTKNQALAERDKMHVEAGQIKEELALLRPKLEAARDAGNRSEYSTMQRKFDELKMRQTRIGAKMDADKDSGNTVAREVEMRKRMIQQEILDGAHILCATLSGSGHDMFRNLSNIEFETVIIDEAAQCVELSALIPLKYGASKCILVGDPKQLPPTVLSQSAQRYGYDQSLFVRMQKTHPEDIYLLDTQYRMHPHISAFPSREFYDSKLIDGPNMSGLRSMPWHDSLLFSPYRFFDVKGVQGRGAKGQSLVNLKEIEVSLQLYRRLKADYPAVDLTRRIGIITPYKAQLAELRFRFAREFGDAINDSIEFNTTDAFQGRECDIIIFSCVRASPTGGIGFMTDIRRMNVGLTRAKSSLWILGDSNALAQGEYWKKLIEDAKQRLLLTDGDIQDILRRPTQKGALPAEASGVHIKHEASALAEFPLKRELTPKETTPEDTIIKSDVAIPVGHGQPPRGPRLSTGSFAYTMDERGVPIAEAHPTQGSGRPVIQTSVPGLPQGKKRPGEDQVLPAAKRGPSPAPPNAPRGPRNPRSTGNMGSGLRAQMLQRQNQNSHNNQNHNNHSNHNNRHHIPNRRPSASPVDPSAMETMGLVPPQRPPAPAPSQPSRNSSGYPDSDSSLAGAQKQASLTPIGAPTGPASMRGNGNANGRNPAMRPPMPRKRAPADPFIKKRPPPRR
ncbi:Helicase SEN1 [Ceratocystis platani]|uniref:Helicase SEN1 n=1 Tax=Ceratocystis fimbriata f. sp. platani TaxID=88771 RepID=A0A0F8DJN3_CERFI|nr:Helicase SEN1 [Ceratocystis platani]